ncbi:MAG TPA: hypothetical protein PLF13_03340 [candidate division Zixibacteria bacterium]|nr:hypothetical protein [candidate division Zixibacteria bacterium]
MVGCSNTTDERSNPLVLDDDVVKSGDKTGTTLPALALTSATAWIKTVTPDSINSIVEFELLVSYDSLSPVERSLLISGLSPSPTDYGLGLQLRDASGAALWTYELTFDVERDGDFTFVEESPSDRMVIQRQLVEEGYSETYTLNGDTRTFEFQSTDVDHVISLEEDMLAAGENVDSLISKLTQADQAIAAVIEDFFAYYETDNSLHGNVDGRLATDLLSQKEICDELVWRNADGTVGGPISLEVSEICVVAADCVMLKCPFGADLNPVCDACAFTLGICFLTEIYNWFFD